MGCARCALVYPLVATLACANGIESDPSTTLAPNDPTDVRDGSTRSSVRDAGDELPAPEAGAKSSPPPVLACEGGTQSCGATCVDVSSNINHCGVCGNACPPLTLACAYATCTASLRVRALIDGRSDSVIAGNSLKWHHIRDAAPGRWVADEPTYLNLMPWLPTWPSEGGNGSCGCDSSSSPPIPRLAAKEQQVTLSVVAGRGSVSIAEQPTQPNGYTLRVAIDDSASAADWYEVLFTYETR